MLNVGADNNYVLFLSLRHFCIELWKKDMKRKSHLSYHLVIARSGTAKDY
jgi:hypothetical protein